VKSELSKAPYDHTVSRTAAIPECRDEPRRAQTTSPQRVEPRGNRSPKNPSRPVPRKSHTLETAMSVVRSIIRCDATRRIARYRECLQGGMACRPRSPGIRTWGAGLGIGCSGKKRAKRFGTQPKLGGDGSLWASVFFYFFYHDRDTTLACEYTMGLSDMVGWWIPADMACWFLRSTKGLARMHNMDKRWLLRKKEYGMVWFHAKVPITSHLGICMIIEVYGIHCN
jgi:hypothetical protein